MPCCCARVCVCVCEGKRKCLLLEEKPISPLQRPTNSNVISTHWWKVHSLRGKVLVCKCTCACVHLHSQLKEDAGSPPGQYIFVCVCVFRIPSASVYDDPISRNAEKMQNLINTAVRETALTQAEWGCVCCIIWACSCTEPTSPDCLRLLFELKAFMFLACTRETERKLVYSELLAKQVFWE